VIDNGELVDAVQCYSGAAYGERPTSFVWEGRRQEVAAIITRTRLPGRVRFYVRTQEGHFFDLIYDEAADRWSIQQP